MNDFVKEHHEELDQLIERYKAFLSKLQLRAREIEEETLQAGQEIADQDEIRLIHFKSGIKNQFDSLTKKALDIFKDQIKEKKIGKYSIGDKMFSESEAYEFNKKINHSSDLYDDFEDAINAIFENIFSKIKVLSPEKKLKEIIKEYEFLKEHFNCTQCGSKLKLEKVYFVSAYISCEYCQSQNTFIPSMKMSLLPDLVREIADKRLGVFQMPSNHVSLVNKFDYWEDFARKQLFIKRDLIPELENSYRDIYLRELNDFNNNYVAGENISSAELDEIIKHFTNKYRLNTTDFKPEDGSEKKVQKKLDHFIFENYLNQMVLQIDLFKGATLTQNAHQSLIEESEKLNNLKATINL